MNNQLVKHQLENDEATVFKFVQDFFVTYDKNRHILHTLFPENGTFMLLGNRVTGHPAIQQAMLTMVTTTHQLHNVDMQNLPITLPENVSMYQVLCVGDVEFGGDSQIHGFTATLLVYFKRPNVLNVVSLTERCQWPKLS